MPRMQVICWHAGGGGGGGFLCPVFFLKHPWRAGNEREKSVLGLARHAAVFLQDLPARG